ncbi:hypothetical protein Ahy_B07g087089 [Arachis hypogaea]|uniref:Uncharacterized protein n=1 Tax=Arachis hypogaea TaxID=3818 RepID=A0A444YB78_ARAHY|nr:hypothetical protein Ahy_B07g087089 [Arachis hypogaea]
MEWEETGRIPPEIFRCFRESIKFKIFGGGDRVSFLANRIGKKLVLWDRSRSSGDVVGDGDGESDGGRIILSAKVYLLWVPDHTDIR